MQSFKNFYYSFLKIRKNKPYLKYLMKNVIFTFYKEIKLHTFVQLIPPKYLDSFILGFWIYHLLNAGFSQCIIDIYSYRLSECLINLKTKLWFSLFSRRIEESTNFSYKKWIILSMYSFQFNLYIVNNSVIKIICS
mgnify:CR=1 FL=1